MSILEILSAIVALIMLIFGIIGIVKQKRDKSWKPKKKNWWFQDHHWRGPLSPPMI